MDQQLNDLQVGGLNLATEAWDHRVVVTTSEDTVTPVTTVALQGVQSKVDVNPEDLQQFGFAIKRVFSLTVPTSVAALTVRAGMRAVEQTTSELARVLWIRRNRIGLTFYFGSVNK